MSDSLPSGISSIGQIAIVTRDVPRALEFYRDRLGLRYLFEAGGMAFLDCGGVRLMLTTPESAEFDHRSSILYFRVEEIDEAFRVASERGVHFRATPHKVADLGVRELWMAFFDDPDGNVMALMSEPLKTTSVR